MSEREDWSDAPKYTAEEIEERRDHLQFICDTDPAEKLPHGAVPETGLEWQRMTIAQGGIHFCEGAEVPKLVVGPVTLCGCCRPGK